MHEGKSHGLNDVNISYLLEKKIKFVICPDSASNDYEIHKILREHGIDILILDHHEAPSISDYACVINN